MRHNFQYDLNTRVITSTGSGSSIPIGPNVVEIKWPAPFPIGGYLYSPPDKRAHPLKNGIIDKTKPAIDLEVMIPGQYEKIPGRENLKGQLQLISDAQLQALIADHQLWVKNGGNKNGGRPLNLEGYDLRGKDFNGLDLRYSKIRHCDLTNANLQGARFTNADLSQSKFAHAQCSKLTQFQDCQLIFSDCSELNFAGIIFCGNYCFGASFEKTAFNGATMLSNDFRECKFKDASLRDVRMEQSDFSNADLTNCNLINANCSYVKFNGATLTQAALAFANCTNADLGHADCTDTAFESSDLSGSNLAFARNVKLDNNRIEKAHFTPAHVPILKNGIISNLISQVFYNNQKDWWNTLRREYTGVKFFIYMFFTLVFFSPVIFKLFLFTMLGYLEETHLTNAFAYGSWKTIYGWQLLLGVNGSLMHMITTCLLLLYNGVRAVLTYRVSRMNDETMVSMTAPSLKQYKTLIPAHYFVKAVFWFVGCRIIWELIQMLSSEIKYPGLL